MLFLGGKAYTNGMDSLSFDQLLGLISAIILFLTGLFFVGQKENKRTLNTEKNKQNSLAKYEELTGSPLTLIFEIKDSDTIAYFSSNKDFICVFDQDSYDVIPFENFTNIKKIPDNSNNRDGGKIRFIFTNSKYMYLDVKSIYSLEDKYDTYISLLGW